MIQMDLEVTYLNVCKLWEMNYRKWVDKGYTEGGTAALESGIGKMGKIANGKHGGERTFELELCYVRKVKSRAFQIIPSGALCAQGFTQRFWLAGFLQIPE